MKRLRQGAVWALACAALLRAACAEDVVTVRMAQARCMQFEPVVLFVTVKNITDDLLIFSDRKAEGDALLDFVLERGPTEWVRRRADGPTVGKVRILPGGQREIMVELSRSFDVANVASYIVRAVVAYGGERFESTAVRFEVSNGLPLEKLTRSLSGGGHARTYSLRYLARDRSERLFLRIDEEDSGDNYGAFDLGPLLRTRRPEIAVDPAGVITVTHQSGVDRLTRSVFKTEGERVEFSGQTYLNEKGQGSSQAAGTDEKKSGLTKGGQK